MMQTGGPPPRGFDPAMRGYNERVRYNNVGSMRGTREVYDPYGQLRRAGPSPWAPATMLGLIVLITTLPYMRTPTIPAMTYQRTQIYTRAASSGTSSFSWPMLWLFVVALVAFEFFGGNDWYQGVYVGDRYGARPGVGYSGRAYGGAATAPGGPYATSRGWGGGWGGWGGGGGGGGWWPSWNNPYNRYNTHLQRGPLSTFMDYGGHWILILLGIAVFALVSASSLPSAKVVPPVRGPRVPLAPKTLGFPWSWFF